MPVQKELKEKLQKLALKYETPDFTLSDPSQFLRFYPLSQKTEVECAAFIASMLSFGNRNQFIPKIQKILQYAADFSPSSQTPLSTWLLAGTPNFPRGPQKFYRFYSFDDLRIFFNEISTILYNHNSLGDYFKSIYEGKDFPSLQSPKDFSATPSSGDTPQRPDTVLSESLEVCPHNFSKNSTEICPLHSSKNTTGVCPPHSSKKTTGVCPLHSSNNPSEVCPLHSSKNTTGVCPHNFSKNSTEVCPLHLDKIISQAFPKSKIVPKGKNSANKRIHMFLRWMVRQNSPVDLGIWSWYPQSQLIIPLDVHVMQESIKLGLLPEKSKASYKTALELTNQLSEIFPGDPCRGDYALFGYGVDKS